MNIFIKTNFEKSQAEKYTNQVIDIMLEQGNTCFMEQKDKKLFDSPKVCYDKTSTILKKIDLIIVLGGDGTILQTVKFAIKSDKPILGINIGRVGFLCQIEKDELHKLELLRNSKLEYHERMLVEATHVTEKGEKKYIALNDFVFSKGILSRMVEIDIKCMGSMIETYRADGIIFSTPSGSTAYGMSAGGPIISPVVKTVLVTPICPYSRFQTPICFGANEEIEVWSKENDIKMVVDGVISVSIGDNDHVLIKGHDKCVKFLKLDDSNFYSHLWNKLRKRG
ncbi:MAG: NAD(+)/NADH kinase [Oscillospiraceae bacterium]